MSWKWVLGFIVLCLMAMAVQKWDKDTSPATSLTFYRDALPILQQNCQSCHRPEGMAPMALVTLEDVRKWAEMIEPVVTSRRMPPWFADPQHGRFANDISLTKEEIDTLAAWVAGGTLEGDERDEPPPQQWAGGWEIAEPNVVVQLPEPVQIPAEGEIDYRYAVVPTGFTEDRWVKAAQLLPSSTHHVHHAVVFIRPPESQWLRSAPAGKTFVQDDLRTEQDRQSANWSNDDILLVYALGSAPNNWSEDMAKLVPSGSDLIFQIHYTTNGKAAEDQTKLGMIFAKQPPKQRVLTLELTNTEFVIPPQTGNYRVEASGTLPGEATLLSFLPHMHVRGKRFEYNILHDDGKVETLLRVNYSFRWQLSYQLAEPRKLRAGTLLQAVAWYDNSRYNPRNPDPASAVPWGQQNSDEMMVGFFDVAVPADKKKSDYAMHPVGENVGH